MILLSVRVYRNTQAYLPVTYYSTRLGFLGITNQIWTWLSLILNEQKISYPAQNSPQSRGFGVDDGSV